MCFLSPRATLQISRQNDRIFRYQVCSKEIAESTAAALLDLLGRVGGMAGGTAGTAQFQSADGSNIGVLSQSGLSSINLFVIATLMGRAHAGFVQKLASYRYV